MKKFAVFNFFIFRCWPVNFWLEEKGVWRRTFLDWPSSKKLPPLLFQRVPRNCFFLVSRKEKYVLFFLYSFSSRCLVPHRCWWSETWVSFIKCLVFQPNCFECGFWCCCGSNGVWSTFIHQWPHFSLCICGSELSTNWLYSLWLVWSTSKFFFFLSKTKKIFWGKKIILIFPKASFFWSKIFLTQFFFVEGERMWGSVLLWTCPKWRYWASWSLVFSNSSSLWIFKDWGNFQVRIFSPFSIFWADHKR